MAIKKLYHGTNAEFCTLDPTRSRNLLDFGTGSYLTDNISQAWGMAKRKFNILGGKMRVLEFDFDDDLLNEEYAREFMDYSVEWTEFVILNRYFPDYDNKYKIIAGPVADGTIPDDIEDYMAQHPGDEWRKRENLEELTKRQIFDNNKKSIQYCFRDFDGTGEFLAYRSNCRVKISTSFQWVKLQGDFPCPLFAHVRTNDYLCSAV